MAKAAGERPRAHPRPLSPHLQIWRWSVTMASSIFHRVSGFGLALGTILLAAWLLALASGPDSYAIAQAIAAHPLGRLVLFGYTLAFVYHLLNGIRHLVWDVGHGFTPAVATRSGVAVFALTLIVTVAVWAAAYAMSGALEMPL